MEDLHVRRSRVWATKCRSTDSASGRLLGDMPQVGMRCQSSFAGKLEGATRGTIKLPRKSLAWLLMNLFLVFLQIPHGGKPGATEAAQEVLLHSLRALASTSGKLVV